MRKVLKNWNVLRVIRFVFGVYVLIQGVYSRDMSYVVIGSLFTLMPVLNIGCCSTSGCATPNRKNEATTEEISYEEVR